MAALSVAASSGSDADHEHAAAAGELAHDRGEELLQRDEALRRIDAAGVEDEALVLLALGVDAGVLDLGRLECRGGRPCETGRPAALPTRTVPLTSGPPA